MTGYPEVISPTEIRFERLLPGPIETVWSYLTESGKRGEWLASGPMELRVGGKVPETLDELITVPGAARKTANVVLGVCFGKAEGVVVDTHVFRISHRLDLAKGDTPQVVEQELMKVLPKDRWISFSHQVIHHGRQVCVARNPKCKDCNLETLCHSKDKTWRS